MIVALIVAGRLLLRPVLRYVANTRQREIFVGFALLLVIGIAALMEMVGLSTALGAFLGGVLLADSEYRHQLELDIEPFKGLLLGLFFIAVGMSVDLGLFVALARPGASRSPLESSRIKIAAAVPDRQDLRLLRPRRRRRCSRSRCRRSANSPSCCSAPPAASCRARRSTS